MSGGGFKQEVEPREEEDTSLAAGGYAASRKLQLFRLTGARTRKGRGEERGTLLVAQGCLVLTGISKK